MRFSSIIKTAIVLGIMSIGYGGLLVSAGAEYHVAALHNNLEDVWKTETALLREVVNAITTAEDITNIDVFTDEFKKNLKEINNNFEFNSGLANLGALQDTLEATQYEILVDLTQCRCLQVKRNKSSGKIIVELAGGLSEHDTRIIGGFLKGPYVGKYSKAYDNTQKFLLAVLRSNFGVFQMQALINLFYNNLVKALSVSTAADFFQIFWNENPVNYTQYWNGSIRRFVLWDECFGLHKKIENKDLEYYLAADVLSELLSIKYKNTSGFFGGFMPAEQIMPQDSSGFINVGDKEPKAEFSKLIAALNDFIQANTSVKTGYTIKDTVQFIPDTVHLINLVDAILVKQKTMLAVQKAFKK
jgi:hypothetical protein